MVKLKMPRDGEGPWEYPEKWLILSKIPTERVALLKNGRNGYSGIDLRRESHLLCYLP